MSELYVGRTLSGDEVHLSYLVVPYNGCYGKGFCVTCRG